MSECKLATFKNPVKLFSQLLSTGFVYAGFKAMSDINEMFSAVRCTNMAKRRLFYTL